MPRKSIWETDAIEWDDLPTVQEVLRAADQGYLIELHLDNTERNEPLPFSKEQRDLVELKMMQALDAMSAMDITPSDKWVVLPHIDLTNVTISGEPLVHSAPASVKREDLAKGKAAAALPVDEFRAQMPEIYGGPMSPWEDLLCQRIWLKRCISHKDRYLLLANLLYQLTFFGITEENQKSELESAVSELVERHKKIESGEERLLPREVLDPQLYKYFDDEKGRQRIAACYGLSDERIDFDREHDTAVTGWLISLSKYTDYQFCEQVAELYDMLEKGYARQQGNLE